MAETSHLPLAYRFFHRVALALLRILTDLDMAGLENVPTTGPVIVAANHMHVLDLVVAFAVIPRRQTVFAADKWQGKVGGWFMQIFANAIFVARGEPDRAALTKALAVLEAGGALGVAPEGTRSRTNSLLPGKPGTVYLACRSGAPILPMVIWGQERAMGTWARLRRPRICVRFATLMHLPPGAERAPRRATELAAYTDELMLTLARMLPPEYRGSYAKRVPDTSIALNHRSQLTPLDQG